MFDFIKNIIEKGNFELKDIIYKINKMYIENHLTEEQKQELEGLARERANPENSYAETNKQFEAIWKALKDLQKEVESLKNQETQNPTDKPTQDEEIITPEYPEWVQPIGSHDAYNIGDIVNYNGRLVQSTIDNNVWSPDVYPQGWEDYIEIVPDESEESSALQE